MIREMGIFIGCEYGSHTGIAAAATLVCVEFSISSIFCKSYIVKVECPKTINIKNFGYLKWIYG
jgi:hypothetical protein